MSFFFTMIISTIVIPAAAGLGLLFLSVKLTVLIETPIIVRFGVTKNRRYIEGVNTLTNVLFNMILAGLCCLGIFLRGGETTPAFRYMLAVWYVLAELILIPVSEAFIYKKISSLGMPRILLCSYTANLVSCLAGVALAAVLLSLSGFWPRG